MVSPNVDPFVATLAAGLAVLTGHAGLAATARAAASGGRRRICSLAIDTLVLGVGLWSACALQALAVLRQAWPFVDMSALVAALSLACLGQLCTLMFAAGGRPGARAVAGSALSFAAAIAATHWATLGAAGHPPGLPVRWGWIGGSLAVAFVGFAAGLRWQGDRGGRCAWRRWAGRGVLALILGAAILGFEAGPFLLSRWSPGSCCTPEVLELRLLAVVVASISAAALSATQVAVLFQLELADRAGRSRKDLAEAHARLLHIATHDPLTGLPNRNLLKERLDKSFCERRPAGRTIAVAALDLDRFSALNHTLGHGAGDGVLVEIAHRLEAAVPGTHMLARVGGDAFVLLIDEVSARMEAESDTDAILAALQQPLQVHGEEIRVRVSIGVSVWPDDARRVDDLLAHAEVALVAAKRSGGGRVVFFEPSMSDSMQERLALENDLRRALAAREFEIHYQPQISTRTGRILSLEALLRWRHPRKGLIMPSSFIPLAEQTGLIVPLEEWVLQEVCRQARSWLTDSGLALSIAVNLSAMQFRRPDILDVVVGALNAADLEPRTLEIELTESTLMTDPEQSASALRLLRSMGVSIAIDDFGTGYSSLSYLRRLPIDKLKIDRSFIRDLPTSPTDESIVRAIVALAHSVRLQVVAEGVETAEQLERIRALDCDQWQGYYCCPPQPAGRLAELLAERGATSSTGLIAALARASRLISS